MHRRNRLGSSSLIGRIHSNGKRIRRDAFTLAFLSEPLSDAAAAEPCRFAIVASRRVGPAVLRNRARRRLRSALDLNVTAVRPGTIAILSASPATNSANFQDLVDSLGETLSKAGLMAVGERARRA